ncbi:hypothetical protein BZG35_08350 [Brevundimonas sp. LM2]|uniref:hypothetical protein n=1 Tax=Brevundimonas sp. LM2 TaxID=1938605 RepID=UPI00098405B1|nr:hypothetical protein [Brevundimonas sp. LM2]AQR61660.1 hypothetical protein BZG35_08350 [Brevundimonas sp. LM2]
MGLTAEDVADTGERAQAYVECRSRELETLGPRAEALMTEARALAEGHNAGVTEINAFIADYRAWALEHGGQ